MQISIAFAVMAMLAMTATGAFSPSTAPGTDIALSSSELLYEAFYARRPVPVRYKLACTQLSMIQKEVLLYYSQTS